MATILEDEDLIAQAQERERARLEEEAALLAFQQQQPAALPPPVWAGSPEAVIDEFNAQPGIVSAPTTIGSEQYMNELARAQRGSGFINALVDPGGNVTVPGYDPSKDFASLKSQQEATNFQRQQYYGSLVQGGSSPAEAYRASWGRYPDIKNAGAEIKLDALMAKQAFQPTSMTLNGATVDQLSQGRFSRRPPVKFVGGKPTPALRAREDILKQQISGLRRQLEPSSRERPLSPERAAQIEAQITGKEAERIALFDAPESNPNVDQIGWENMRERFNAPLRAPIPVAPTAATPAQAKAVNEVRKMTKDGKVAVFDRETQEFIRFE